MHNRGGEQQYGFRGYDRQQRGRDHRFSESLGTENPVTTDGLYGFGPATVMRADARGEVRAADREALQQPFQPQQAKRSDRCGVLDFAVADHPLDF
jgi:hypothetical protein